MRSVSGCAYRSSRTAGRGGSPRAALLVRPPQRARVARCARPSAAFLALALVAFSLVAVPAGEFTDRFAAQIERDGRHAILPPRHWHGVVNYGGDGMHPLEREVAPRTAAGSPHPSAFQNRPGLMPQGPGKAYDAARLTPKRNAGPSTLQGFGSEGPKPGPPRHLVAPMTTGI